MKTNTTTLKYFVETSLNYDGLTHGTTTKVDEATRLYEAATAKGRKTTIGSVKEAVGQTYRKYLDHKKKKIAAPSAAAPRKNGRTLAKNEVMRLARLGAQHDLARLLREVEVLRIFLKGVES